VRVSFWHHYEDMTAGADTGKLQYSTTGASGTFTTIMTYDSDVRGVPEVIDVSTYVAGHTNVVFQWLYDDRGVSLAWYWRLDDIVVEALE
jgi:hypothetical protein